MMLWGRKLEERERGIKSFRISSKLREKEKVNEPLKRRGDSWTDVVGLDLVLAIFSGILSVVLVITSNVVSS